MTACTHCHTPLPDGSRFCPTCGVDSSDPTSAPRTGAKSADIAALLRDVVEGHYDVEDMLGRGGMGAVFLAHDRKLDRQVAIKVLPPELASDEQFVGRFKREARTAAKLDHPGIIPIYAVESEGDLHFFVMKYVSGRGLDSVIGTGSVPVELTQRIVWEAAVALGHAHARGVVHRDIKPANIMVDQTGRVMLTDFGISKALQSASQFTATGQVIGTPHYMSPEQAKGDDVSHASDQYSLGVVGYRMLTGRLPFEDDSVHTIIYKHVFEDPTPIEQLRPDIPSFLTAAIRRAMAKDPAHRFPNMEAMATAVWPAHPVEPETRESAGMVGRQSLTSSEAPTEVSHATVVTGPSRKRRVVPALLSVVAIALAAAAMLVFTPYGNTLLERAGVRVVNVPEGESPSPPVTGIDSQTTVVAQPELLDTTVTRDPEPPPARSQPREQQQAPAPVPTPVRPRPQRPRPVPVVPRIGFLTVNTTPYGTVYVDEQFIGDTPQVRMELSVGQHVVRISREGFQTIIDTVTITAREETRINKPLTRGGS